MEYDQQVCNYKYIQLKGKGVVSYKALIDLADSPQGNIRILP